MNQANLQPWYQKYAAALVELDDKRLKLKIESAETAIHLRLNDLRNDPDHHEERQLMTEAQRTLRILRAYPLT